MPPIRFLASKRRAYVVAIILLFGEIMPTYSRCVLKGLIYVVIIALLGRQPSSYIECTKLNIRSSYNVRLVFNVKCMFLARLYTF